MMKIGASLRPSLRLFVVAAWPLFLMGCVAPSRVQTPRASDYFGRQLDFGFVTGHLARGLTPGYSRYFPGFPVAPHTVVTAGHCFRPPTGVGESVGFGLAPVPTLVPGTVTRMDCRDVWMAGKLEEHVPIDPQAGDFALIRLYDGCAVSKWDRYIDPTLRPKPGEIVLVGPAPPDTDPLVFRVVERPEWGEIRGIDLPDDIVVVHPSSPDFASGSPAKMMVSTTGKAEDARWYTFGLACAGVTNARTGEEHMVIVPLPEHITEIIAADTP